VITGAFSRDHFFGIYISMIIKWLFYGGMIAMINFTK